jgi:hypothetical protein
LSSIAIGADKDGRPVRLDLDVLLRTRLLVQANSGGGKSYALRRILEQAFGKVQCIVIDPAGEFATLREKFEFVLVGKGGETPADIRSAGLVAEKLLELRASAVCDLYGMKPHERAPWVKNFLTATMNVPKKLWHPVLFVVDEAHKFCPEKGEGESEAKGEMLQLVSDGRKYGFCAILATQRLAKLDKSAAAELLNVLIGPTFIDIDLERAHKALGIVREHWKEFDAQMKTVEPGHFWALGRAISKERILVKVGGIQTTHPEAGSHKAAAEPPPAPDKIKELLPKLADLPAAAEEKQKSIAELRREVIDLRRQLRAAGQSGSAKAAFVGEVEVWKKRAAEEAKRHLSHISSVTQKLKGMIDKVQKSHQLVEAAMVRVRQTEDECIKVVSEIGAIVSQRAPSVSSNGDGVSQNRPTVPGLGPRLTVTSTEPAKHDPTLPDGPERDEKGREGLSGPEQRILDAIAWQNAIGIDQPSQVAVAFLANYTYGTGGFNNARGALRSKGLVEYIPGDRIALTLEGKRCANPPDMPLTTEELHRRVLDVLETPHQRILKPLLQAYPKPLSDEELAPLAGYKPGVGGFNNPKGRLRSLGLIEYPQPRHAVAAKILFPED